MGIRLQSMLEKIRSAKGPFFVARLGLRVKFSLSNPELPDSPEIESALRDACLALGYQIPPSLMPSPEP